MYDFLDSVYMISKLFAMAPFGRYKNQNGKYVYFEYSSGKYLFCSGENCQQENCGQNCHVLGWLVLTLTGLFLGALNAISNQKLDTIGRYIYLGSTTQLTIGSATITFNFCRHSSYYLEAFRLLHSVDKDITQLGLKISYRTVHISTNVAKSFFILSPLFLIYEALLGRDLYLVTAENLCFGVPVVMIMISISLWTILCITIKNRFQLINNYLINLNSKKHSTLYIEQRTVFVSKLHQQLCQSTECLTNCLSSALLVAYFECLVFFTASMLIILDIKMDNYKNEVFFWTMLYTTITFLVATTMELTTVEVQLASVRSLESLLYSFSVETNFANSM